MKIKEIIVVEGKDDTAAIKQAVNADTIETNGSALMMKRLKKLDLRKKQVVLLFSQILIFLGKKLETRFRNK